MDAAEKLPEEIVNIAIKVLLELGIVNNAPALIAFAQQTNSHFIFFLCDDRRPHAVLCA